MKNKIDYSKIKFNDRLDAQDKLDSLKRTAEEYGFVYVGDFYDMCGYGINYDEQYNGWTIGMLDNAKVVYDDNGEYYIDLPKALPMTFANDKQQDTPTKFDESVPQPELLNITIRVNEIDVYDPDEIISSVLKQISQIKDRTVNLTIM